MKTSIVCGIDGSTDSEAALTLAATMAERLGARLVLAHVAEPVLVPYSAPFGGLGVAGPLAAQEATVAHEDAAAHLLEEVTIAAGVDDAEHRIAFGLPAERLAEIADEENAELIVVGSRGRGAFKAAFLGSVSNSLVGIARCPVLIVPPGSAAS